MGFTLKQRYARLDMSKLPKSYTDEFEIMDKETRGFSDDDLNAVFAENFNDMYDLVEKKYPAAIKKGGTVRKEKPAKVKVVKAKGARPGMPPASDFDGIIPEHPIHKGEVKDEGFRNATGSTKAMRNKLSVKDINFIESTLVNDEDSSDEELVEYIAKETGLSFVKAKKWVALRKKYRFSMMDAQKPENIAAYAGMTHLTFDYSTRTAAKKAARKGKKGIVKTRDDKEIDRKSNKNIGKTFYDENGKAWKCKGYNAKLDECILEDADGKEISACIEEMYTTNPVTKREKGNLVDDCKETLKEAGYTVREHKAGNKKIKRSEPRPEKIIIKERVEDTFTPIMKELKGSEEKEKENKQIIVVLESIQFKFTTIMNRISNLADDNRLEALKKILKLLDEIIG